MIVLSLYQVLTLMVKAYMETLLKEESPPNGFDCLYWVLTLMANFYNLYQTLTLTTKRRCGDIKMNHPGGKL